MEKRHQVLHMECEEPVKAWVTYSDKRISKLYIRFSGCTGGKGGIEQAEDYTFFVTKEMKIIN
jgi:hypothetical protein